MTDTLIAADDILTLGSIIFGLVAFGFWSETNKIGKTTSGVVWILTIALILSNLKIIPYSSPLYDSIFRYAVTLSIPLLLLKANLRTIFAECGSVLKIFLFAILGTSLGVFVGFYLFNLGDLGPKIAGVYAGGYIGGAMNMVAVSQAVEMTESDTAAAFSAGAPVSIIALLTLAAIPTIAFLRKLIPSEIIDDADENVISADEADHDDTPHFFLTHVSAALALSFIICATSAKISKSIGIEQYNLLIVTTLTVIVANIIPKQLDKLEGEFSIGMFFMYLFFAAIGASTNLTEFLGSAVLLFFYAMTIITVHFIFILLCAKLFKFDLAETVVASGAALVGPAVTAAIASSKGWKKLITPAILTGIFGYVAANFIGVAITKFLS